MAAGRDWDGMSPAELQVAVIVSAVMSWTPAGPFWLGAVLESGRPSVDPTWRCPHEHERAELAFACALSHLATTGGVPLS